MTTKTWAWWAPLRRCSARTVAVWCLLAVWPTVAAAQNGPVDATILYLGPAGSVCKGTSGSAPSAPSTCDWYINTTDGKLYMRWSTGAWVAAGSVYSVGNGTIGPLFAVSWSTATTTPALNLNFATQSANCLLAGPTSGGAAVPTCRTMVLADIPDGLVTDAKVNAAAAIAWTKLSKTGSSLADLATRSAADLSSGILPDARMPNLTGDVTTVEGAVAATIANDAVTLAKMANMATLSVIGRSTAGTGDPEVISAGTDHHVLRRSGSSLSFGLLAKNSLPSAVAYEDEANTFTQAQAFSAGIASHLIPSQTDTFDIGSPSFLWNQGYLSQLNAILFALETQTLFGGYSTIGHDAGTLGAAVASGDTTVNFGKTMTPGNFVLIRSQDTGGTYTSEYMTVGSLVSGTTYNVTRNLSGAGAKNWADGLPFLVKENGAGEINLFAYDGKPRIVFAQQGATYNAQTVRAVLGSLNGYCGYATDLYGMCVGAESGARITVDPTNGVVIRDGAGTARVSVTPAGAATFVGDGGGVTNVNGGNIQTDTITATQIAANAITTSELNADSVTSAKIAANTIVAGDIAADTITASQIAANAITATELAADAVTSAKILAGTIVASDIATGSITADRLNVSSLSAITANIGTVTAGTMTGVSITATTGAIGGCALASGSIVCGTSNDVASLLSTDATWRVCVGHASCPSAPFRVDKDGNVTMTQANITAQEITLGTPDGGFDESGAYKFLRSGGSGDRYGVNAFSVTSAYYRAALENVVDNGTDVDVEAEAVLRARGWTSVGSGTAGADVSVTVRSELGTSRITLEAGNDSFSSGEVVVDADRLIAERAVHLEAEITPSTITGHTNNYNPSGLETTFCLRLSTNGANYQITGLVAPTALNAGRTACIINVGTNNFILIHQSGSSTDVNRFRLPNNTNLEITQNMMVWLRYDNTFQRWVVR